MKIVCFWWDEHFNSHRFSAMLSWIFIIQRYQERILYMMTNVVLPVWVPPDRSEVCCSTMSCLGLLRCIELCIFLCRLVSFVSTLAKWLAGKTYSHDIFRVKGFPLHITYWRVIYCNDLLYVFPTRNIFNFLINFTFLTATYFSKARHSRFVLKVPLNPNQSINPCAAHHSRCSVHDSL